MKHDRLAILAVAALVLAAYAYGWHHRRDVPVPIEGRQWPESERPADDGGEYPFAPATDAVE